MSYTSRGSRTNPRYMYDSFPRMCERGGCQRACIRNKSGSKKANNDGWLFQDDGKAWCPDHAPKED